MSVHWSSWVWSNSPYRGTDLIVHLALADMANDEGVSWPSVKTLAERARVSERQIFKIIARMMAEGLLEKSTRARDNNSQQSNLYQLVQRSAPAMLAPRMSPARG
ncbi:MAG: helix-turn-helix domain-containing protein, partial [Acidobacteriales bacterium]|nr:helix-turn-helix domain-containing protein [Terriglobales bacterium]